MQIYLDSYIKSLPSPNSHVTVRKNLRAVLTRLKGMGYAAKDDEWETFDWHALDHVKLNYLRSRLLDDGLKANTINNYLTHTRKTLDWAMCADKLSAQEFSLILKSLTSVRSNNKKSNAMVEGDEIDLDNLFQNFTTKQTTNEFTQRLNKKTVSMIAREIGTTSTKRVRDKALFMCGCYAGLRREEMAELQIRDVNFSEGKIIVTGKGAKTRSLVLKDSLLKSLKAWFIKVATQCKDDNKSMSTNDYIFRPVSAHGKIGDDKLTNDGVYKIIRKIGDDVGIDKLSPHDLRYYFGTALLISGRDFGTVARLLGHSNISTTRKYDKRSDVMDGEYLTAI